ncbi:MAG: glycosyltransferase family 2 protein [Cyclobacteriaceae bacterium]
MSVLPLVTIIIPVFNRPTLVAEAIDSVLTQTNPNWECIVVDDQSTDTTWEVLQEYAARDERIRVFKRDREPKGAPTCRNLGAELANGEYLIFLDSDDYLVRNCLENRLNILARYINYDFIVFPMGIKTSKGIIRSNIPKNQSYLLAFLSYRLYWQTMCPIWKRQFVLDIGGFDESLPRLNDPDIMIRSLVESEKGFYIASEEPYDCVYNINSSVNECMDLRVYESLLIFLPKISRFLSVRDHAAKVHYLKAYLYMWLNTFFFPNESSRIYKPAMLFFIAYKSKIINLQSFLKNILGLVVYSVFNFISYRCKRFVLKQTK